MQGTLLGFLCFSVLFQAPQTRVVDEPNRFNKGVCGHIVALNQGSRATVTVALDEMGTLLNLDLSPKASVRFAFEGAGLGDLREGQKVSLRLGPDHRTVIAVHIQGQIREGTIQSITPNGKLTIIESNEETGETKSFEAELPKDLIIRIGGLPASLADLRPEMVIPLEISLKGKKVNAIEAEAKPGEILTGQLLNLELKENKIEFAAEENDDGQLLARWLPLAPDAIIMVDEKIGKKQDIKIHSDVQIRLSPDGKTIRAIKATSPPPEGDQ